MLQYFEHAESAEQRAQFALKVDEDDWRASTLLAELVEPSKGIETLKPATQRVKSSGEWKKSSLHRMGLAKMLFVLAELQWKKGSVDAAVDSWKKALELGSNDYRRVRKCLEEYSTRGRWSDIMEALQTITESSTKQQHGLEELLIATARDMQSVHIIILRAALHTEQLGSIVCAYEHSIELLEERGDCAMLCYVQYHYGRAIKAVRTHSSPAIKQWRQALEYADPPLLACLITYIAPYYVKKVSASSQDPEAVAFYLDQIEKLIPEDVLGTEVMLSPKVYVARYYVTQGDMARAKQFVHGIVNDCVDILTDDIDENDLRAYNKLIWIFVALNDYENLRAIHALRAQRFRGHQTVRCDGDCNRSWDLHQETSWCQDCININFETDCREKIKRGALPFSICNESHEFIQVPEVDLTDAPEDCVPVEDGWIPAKYWFSCVEKKYVHF